MMSRVVSRAGMAAVLLMLATAALGHVSAAETHAVQIADFAFAPASLTVTAGDTVTWTNGDPIVHTATSTTGAFDSGDLPQGASFSFTFTTPGTYDYVCTPHPTMTGRIVVVAAPAAPSPSSGAGGGLPNVALRPETANPLTVLGGILVVAATLLLLVRAATARGRS